MRLGPRTRFPGRKKRRKGRKKRKGERWADIREGEGGREGECRKVKGTAFGMWQKREVFATASYVSFISTTD